MGVLFFYLFIGAVGHLTRLFGIEVLDAKSGSANAALSLVASMVCWPVPFMFFVKAWLEDE
jgi:hypothetical protein